jgi:hypothetical protein
LDGDVLSPADDVGSLAERVVVAFMIPTCNDDCGHPGSSKILEGLRLRGNCQNRRLLRRPDIILTSIYYCIAPANVKPFFQNRISGLKTGFELVHSVFLTAENAENAEIVAI